MKYVIEIVGAGKRRRYIIKQTPHKGLLIPVDGRQYKTLEAAQDAAAALGLTISAIGDLYDIL